VKNVNELNVQTGYLYSTDGKKFDVSVILNFPTYDDYENPNSTDDDLSVNLIDFYFGEPNDSDTEMYVNQFIEKQNRFQSLLNKLYNLKIVCPEDTEIDEQIEFVKSLIVKLH
jgi:hypothetical protein